MSNHKNRLKRILPLFVIILFFHIAFSGCQSMTAVDINAGTLVDYPINSIYTETTVDSRIFRESLGVNFSTVEQATLSNVATAENDVLSITIDKLVADCSFGYMCVAIKPKTEIAAKWLFSQNDMQFLINRVIIDSTIHGHAICTAETVADEAHPDSNYRLFVVSYRTSVSTQEPLTPSDTSFYLQLQIPENAPNEIESVSSLEIPFTISMETFKSCCVQNEDPYHITLTVSPMGICISQYLIEQSQEEIDNQISLFSEQMLNVTTVFSDGTEKTFQVPMDLFVYDCYNDPDGTPQFISMFSDSIPFQTILKLKDISSISINDTRFIVN